MALRDYDNTELKGYEAFQCGGFGMAANPFKLGNKSWKAWQAGWLRAAREHTQGTQIIANAARAAGFVVEIANA